MVIKYLQPVILIIDTLYVAFHAVQAFLTGGTL